MKNSIKRSHLELRKYNIMQPESGGTVQVSESGSSGGFIDEEGDLALFESEINEAVAFVDGMAAETLAQEHVPVRLPLVVHVSLHLLCYLHIRYLDLNGLPRRHRFRSHARPTFSLQ